MAVPVLAIIIGLIMIGLSVRANARFRAESRLPMQWSLSSSVNWTAPRIVALSFTPVLAIAILMLFVIGAMTLHPRPGQEGAVIPVLIAMGTCFIAAHLFHLWMIAKTLRSGS